jgi:hypothetical protein
LSAEFLTFTSVFRKDPLMFNRLWSRHLTWIVFGLTSMASACGDDSDNTSEDAGPGDGGTQGGKGGSSGKGASGGKGGSGGTAGSEGGKGGSGGKAGSGGSAGSAPTMQCTEDPPASPFKCGDDTCTAPTFANNPCVVPCCIQVNGQSKCGAKSTSEMFPAVCSLPAEPSTDCPEVTGGMGGAMQGCCNYEQGKCGIISTARPGCITQSTFVEIPEKACSKPATDTDAGEPDAG